MEQARMVDPNTGMSVLAWSNEGGIFNAGYDILKPMEHPAIRGNCSGRSLGQIAHELLRARMRAEEWCPQEEETLP